MKHGLISLLFFVLSACGSGDDGGAGNNPGGGTTDPDTTPEAFVFIDLVDVELNTLYESNEISITGINAQTAISIVDGEYSIDGAEFTASDGMVGNNQTVTVRQTSSSEFTTQTDATLTVGNVSDTFSATTREGDNIPDEFVFTDQSNVALGTLIISNPITVQGIDAPARVSISGGEYSIDENEFTSEDGTISNNQTISIRQMSSAEFLTQTDATLTISGISDTFSLTTRAADVIPDPFIFIDQSNVPLNSSIVSDPVVIQGIEAPATLSISGGEYSIDGNEFTHEDGTISNNQTISIRQTSSGEFLTQTDATLTINGISDTFSLTTRAADITPDEFIFTDQTNVPLNSITISDPVTIQGIEAPAPVSISGGEYSIDASEFTHENGTISNGQSIRLRQTSANAFATQTDTTLSINGISDTFSVTTLLADTTPGEFSFTDQNNVPISTWIESNLITISDINTSAAISIIGGEYSIDEGEYTGSAGHVSDGQSITVRLMSSLEYNSQKSATLTIGNNNFSATFNTTTAASSFTPAHEPLTGQDHAHHFRNVHIHPDGRIAGIATLTETEMPNLFLSGPDTSSFTRLTPKTTNGGHYAFSNHTAVYIDNGVLYSASNTHSATRLSGDEEVERYWISPDESKVLYVTTDTYIELPGQGNNEEDDPHNNRNELYIVNIEGGSRIKLSPDEPDTGVFYEYYERFYNPNPQFLPDTSRVIFIVFRESTLKNELHSINLDGSDRQILSDDLFSNSYLGRYNSPYLFTVSPDSSYIVFPLTDSQDKTELFSISPYGNSLTQISGNLFVFREASTSPSTIKYGLSITADSSLVILLAHTEGDSANHLYKVTPDGNNLTKITDGANLNLLEPPLVTSDNSTLVYATFGTYEIYSTPMSGGNATLLHNARGVQLELIDDESAVVFVSPDNQGTYRLYLAKLDGTSTIDLSGNMIEDGDIHRNDSNQPYYLLDPSREQIVFRADAEIDNDYALYAVDLEGNNRVKLTPDRTHNSYTQSNMFAIVDDKLYFAYDKDFWTFTELYEYNFTNKQVSNISALWSEFITEDAKPHSFTQSQNGSVQSFVTDTSAYRDTAIVINNESSNCRIDLEANIRALHMPANFFLSTLGDNLYYTLYDSTDATNWEFYRASTDSCTSTLLNGDIAEQLARMKLSPDGSHVVYSTGTNIGGGLYITDNNGDNSLMLNASRTVGGVERSNIGSFRFSHNSSRVIYVADQDVEDVYELYSVTLDGTTTNKINGPLVNGGRVYSDGYGVFAPQISPDDQWVLYLAKQDNAIWELYKSRLDGTDNTKLSGTLSDAFVYQGNHSQTVKITNDSSRAVYIVYDTSVFETNLHSVNLQGVPSPIKLNPNFNNSGQILSYTNRNFLLTPDSNSVIYLSQDGNDEAAELFSVKLDGSDHTKLNSTLVEDGEVHSFDLSSDGSKVVYTASEQDPEIVGLYSCNIDGSNKVHLADVQPPNQNYPRPQLTGDDRAVFRATLNGIDGIYIVPIAGGTPTRVVAIPAMRTVNAHISNNNQIIVFGDLRQLGIIELFRFNI